MIKIRTNGEQLLLNFNVSVGFYFGAFEAVQPTVCERTDMSAKWEISFVSEIQLFINIVSN